jgi:glutamate-ammonia-ligase adenylyltransferase
MRARLARDAAPSNEFDLKHRAGGMMELGFIVEALQLIHGPAHPALFVPRTVTALNCLADSGLLDRRTADRLIAADRLFRTVQGMFRITGLQVPLTDSSRVMAAPLLAAAGALDSADLAAKVDAAAVEVRATFVALIGPIKEGEIG